METDQQETDNNCNQPGPPWEDSSSRLRLILLLGSAFGLRISEALSLTLAQLDTTPEAPCDETNDNRI
jgi:site-specific recombinase XerD